MKNRIFGAAVALIAATNLAFVGGAAHATTYTPVLVKTLSTSGSGSIANIQAVGDKVVFEYNDAIWVSDGTEAGTVELDAPATLTSWELQADRWHTYSAEIDGALYFFGWNSADSAYQVYKTDGTSITQVTTGAGFSNYDLLVARGGDLYAWVENNENSNGYWDIDQITPAGVVSVLDGGNDCGPSRDATQIQLIGSKLIYRNDPTESCDYGIYAYDLGTDSIEELDTVAGLYGSEDYIYDNNDAWYVFNGEVYYSAYGASDIGYELFASDGTADGSRLVKDIYDGSNGSYPSSDYDCSFIPQTLGDYFYFTAYNNNGSRTLFKSDGTTGGTTEAVSDANGLQYSGCDTYSQPPVLNGKLIIDFWASGLSYEMYATDGTDAGTTLLKDIAVGGDAGLCKSCG
jgi:ELWxxDGT repeat protein